MRKKPALVHEGGRNWISLMTVLVMTLVPRLAVAQSDTIQTTVPALKDVFAHDFYIGCLLSYRNIGFPTDPPVPGTTQVATPNGGYLIKYHMNSMSPGNNMKPENTLNLSGSAAAYSAAATPEARDSINTHPLLRFNSDMIAQFNWAQRQGFTFRGHTLIWHNQTPAAFFLTGYSSTGVRLTKEQMTARMENYIKEIIRLIHESWPGLLSAIDVVNEAVNDDGTDRTASDWYTTYGDNSYIMKAFEFARKYTVQYGETQIKLYYNDYNTSTASKADGIVRLCQPIYQAGYLDGIGMQEHDANTSPTAEQWIATYNKFDPICSEMAVTELDVTTGSGSPSASVLATQANQYGQLFKCFVERSYKSGRGKIISVSKDGLNDAYTFKTNQSSSLWDANNQCKPAFYAVVSVGQNYTSLDSLITVAGTLQQSVYTSASWRSFATALASATTARDQNYSATLSAATGLQQAKNDLKAAIDGLVTVVSDITHHGTRPVTFELRENYPNPFNPSTTVSYQLPTDSRISLKVFDLLGREMAVLAAGVQTAGLHVVTWNAADAPSGVYVVRLEAQTGSGGAVRIVADSKRMVLLR